MRTPLLTSILLASLIACGGSPPPAARAPDPTPAAEPPPGTPTVAPAPVLAGPTAEEAMDWVLANIESGGAVTTADVEARFSPAFLQQRPADQVVTIFAELNKQLPPFKRLKAEGKAPLELSVVLDTVAGGVRVSLQMTKTEPRRIAGLLFAPATAEAPPRTYGDAVAQLGKAGARSQLFVAEIEKGKCTPRQNHNPLERLAIGSTAKLWVLLATDEKLKKDRKLDWGSPLKIRDEGKSLPSGELQDVAAGTEVPVREVALKMISISDNTATDHLIDLATREGVEKALDLSKHSQPAVNKPFLRTRELFGLKMAATPAELDTYRKVPLAAKRKLLEDYRKRPVDLQQAITEWKAPRALDLEWFATGPDLCNVMATLGARGEWKPDSELLTILSKNPGVPYDKEKWTYLGFKGGSEPGVMNLTWLGRRVDGKWFVLVTTVNDDQKPVDEALIVNAATGALAILGNEAAASPPAP